MRSIAILGLAFTACARMPEPQQSFVSSGSGYSASFSDDASLSGSAKSISVPAHEPIVADVVARPDLLAMNFAIRTTEKSADLAIAGAKKELAAVEQKMKALGGEKTNIRPCGFRWERGAEDKEKVILDGAIEIPLDASLDYWARAALMAKVSALIAPPVVAQSKVKAEVEEDAAIVGYSVPRFLVKNTENYRGELMKKWVERAKAFSEVAGGNLRLVRCEPPAAIVQSAISFEEIALSLRMACQLDAP